MNDWAEALLTKTVLDSLETVHLIVDRTFSESLIWENVIHILPNYVGSLHTCLWDHNYKWDGWISEISGITGWEHCGAATETGS